MIWNSIALMTMLDIVIVATAAISLFVLHGQSPALARLGLLKTARVLAVGIFAIGFFYIVDLFAMWGLPLFIPYSQAMAFMEVLHLNYTWGLMLLVVGCVGVSAHLLRGALQETTLLASEIERREQVETRLRRTQVAVDQSADPIYWVQENGQIRYANDAACRVLGYSREEILSMTVSEFDPDFPSDAWPQHWREMKEAGSLRFEAHHQTKAGKVFPVEIYTSFFRSDGNEYIWAHVDDITEKVAARDEITELNRALEKRVSQRTAEMNTAQQGLQRVFDLSVDMLCIATLEGQFLRVNPAFGQTLGYADEELLAKPYLEFVHPDDREATLAVMREKLGTGEEVLNFENRYRHKDGSYRWLRWTSRPVVEDGVTYATARDITEEKLAAAELVRHRDHLEELVAEGTAELRHASEQHAAAARLGEKALAGLPPDEVMQEAVEVVAREMSADYSRVLELLPGGNELLLRAGVGWHDGLVGTARVDAGRESQAGYTLDSDAPVFVEDLATETRFTGPAILTDHGVVCGISVVIRGADKPFGVLCVHYAEPRALRRQDADFVQSIANVIGDAVALQRERDKVNLSARTMRALTARVERVREEERTGLARELHDELGQALTAVNIDLGWMGQKLEDSDPALRERMRASMELVAEMIKTVQRISSDLRPPALDDLGLLEAIRWYVDAFAQRSGLTASVDLPEHAPDLGDEATTAVFRVVQEALTNVARHADASEVRVLFDSPDDSLRVRVIDDGRGIPAEKITGGLSLGLLGMQERAASFGGEVRFTRRPDVGTEVVLTIPLASNTGSTRE